MLHNFSTFYSNIDYDISTDEIPVFIQLTIIFFDRIHFLTEFLIQLKLIIHSHTDTFV